jgi:uncharacterized protein (TIGR02246 family)
MKILTRTLLVPLLFLAACAHQQPPQPVEPPDTRAADEAAIRATAKDWAAASQAKDPQKFASFYTEDARLMFEGAPDTVGTGDILKFVAEVMQDPNFSLNFETTSVDVARSGDIAYELGTYRMTASDPKTRQPATQTGTFVAVWKKQADGSWKCAVDAPNSDAPEPAPAK